jgi:hypothetical protein
MRRVGAGRPRGRIPVNIGAEGKLVYVYRGDVANRAIQLAGMELQMFTERRWIRFRER